MIKKLFLLAIPCVFLLASCNQTTKDAENKKADTATLAVLTFFDSASNHIGKPIRIEGTVIHTCKHGGKRMFLVDGTDSIRVEITAGNNITKFDESLIGSKVKVLGVLKEERVDAKYLNEWEAEVKKPAENHSKGIHTGAKGHEDKGTQDKLDEINSLRNDLKNSGKDHLSFFSVEAISYTVVK